MPNTTFRLRYALILLGLLTIASIFSCIGAHYPADWWLENMLVFGLIGFLVFTYKRIPFSSLSYTLIFLYLCLHELGAHWTYSEVPYNEWWRSLFGISFNEQFGIERNHFDRVVHFLYGFLIFYPLKEAFERVGQARGFWGYFVPVNVIMSTSMIYELIEWIAAEILGGELGQAYNGTQGDIWDPQKDMALASIGAVLAAVIVAIYARCKKMPQ